MTTNTEVLKPKDVAAQMANVLFNLAQKCGHTLTSDDCMLFDNLRMQWDAARRPAQASEASIRDAALEEAAELLAHQHNWITNTSASVLIRALQSTTPAEPVNFDTENPRCNDGGKACTDCLMIGKCGAEPVESIPEGYVILPIEPDAEMRLASKRYKARTKITTGPGFYKAMIAVKLASPTQPMKE
jgi:hypothetical protein